MPLSGMPMLKSVPERPDKTEKSARDFPETIPFDVGVEFAVWSFCQQSG
jgi:hypothetical protein